MAYIPKMGNLDKDDTKKALTQIENYLIQLAENVQCAINALENKE